MRDTKCVILSVVAVVLVVTIGACTAVNPYAAIGLPPVLAAIAWIIRAIGESSSSMPSRHPSNHVVTDGDATPHTDLAPDCTKPDRYPDHLGGND
jgi:hypothetical protein